MNRLLFAVSKHPDRFGVGIDEATAIEVHGQECEVLGNSFVVLVSGTGEPNTLDIQTFEAGETFLLQRKSTTP